MCLSSKHMTYGNYHNLKKKNKIEKDIDSDFFLCVFRSGMMTRHRSMTEASQVLRQIEIPKKTTRAVRFTRV